MEKYVHCVANPWIEARTAKEQNRTEHGYTVVYTAVCVHSSVHDRARDLHHGPFAARGRHCLVDNKQIEA